MTFCSQICCNLYKYEDLEGSDPKPQVCLLSTGRVAALLPLDTASLLVLIRPNLIYFVIN